MLVLDVCCRWPGSAHDAIIFANTRLCEKLHNGEIGSDVALLTIKPLRAPQTDRERNYQYAQIRTRNDAEHTYYVRFDQTEISMPSAWNALQSESAFGTASSELSLSKRAAFPEADIPIFVNMSIYIGESITL